VGMLHALAHIHKQLQPSLCCQFVLVAVIGYGNAGDIFHYKDQIIDWLKRSAAAVKTAHLAAKPADLQRKVKIMGRDATVHGIYLRILVHANEHMGQLVAYARMNGIVPPWSRSD